MAPRPCPLPGGRSTSPDRRRTAVLADRPCSEGQLGVTAARAGAARPGASHRSSSSGSGPVRSPCRPCRRSGRRRGRGS